MPSLLRDASRRRRGAGAGVSARILDISPDEYHARPGLSSTIAKTLLARSPLHAKSMIGKRPTKGMDRGSIIHRLLLGKGKDYVVINHANFTTKLAKAERDAARAAGLVPVIADDFEDYCKAAESIRVQLADRDLILDGESEVAIEWDEPSQHGLVTCRGMLDHAWLDSGLILDLKITEDAAPSAIERTAENFGYAIQAAAYTRAVTALDPSLAGRVRFLFAFCEPDEPYAVNIVQPDGVFRELGDRRWDRAVREWGRCEATGIWPSYGTAVNQLTPPTWALAKEGYATDER